MLKTDRTINMLKTSCRINIAVGQCEGGISYISCARGQLGAKRGFETNCPFSPAQLERHMDKSCKREQLVTKT